MGWNYCTGIPNHCFRDVRIEIQSIFLRDYLKELVYTALSEQLHQRNIVGCDATRNTHTSYGNGTSTEMRLRAVACIMMENDHF